MVTLSPAVSNGENPSSLKKARIEERGQELFEEVTPNLLALYLSDLGGHILSYASASDLCTLDTLNKQFCSLTTKAWKNITRERFGLKNGKDGWRLGTSFLRKPVYIHIDTNEQYGELYYNGAPRISTNDTLIAVDTDDRDESEVSIHGTGLFDATDLSFLGPRRGGGWETTLAGPAENQVFISTTPDFIKVSRGERTRQIIGRHNNGWRGTAVIATETHVIVVLNGYVLLYEIVPNDNVVELRDSKRIQRNLQDIWEYHRNSITWGADQSEFIVCSSIRNERDDDFHTSKISIFHIDSEDHSISHSQTFETGMKLKDVAMNGDFIAGSCELKKIHVWDRHTMQKRHSFLCDLNERDQLHESQDVIFGTLHMSCHGNILVTTSQLGACICIWDMKDGKLLARHNEADEDGSTTLLPVGVDPYSMAYSKPLNCYICTCGTFNVWSFPMNEQQMYDAMMIREREEEARLWYFNQMEVAPSK